MSIGGKAKRNPLDTPEFWGQNTVAHNSNLENFWNFIDYITTRCKVPLKNFEDLFFGIEKLNFPVTLHSSTNSFILVDSCSQKYTFEIMSSQPLSKYKYYILEANNKATVGWYFKIENHKIHLFQTSYANKPLSITYTYELGKTCASVSFNDSHSVTLTYDKPHNASLETAISEFLFKNFIYEISFNNVLDTFKEIIDIFKNANLEVSNLVITSTGPDKDVPLLSKIELKDGNVKKYIFTFSSDSSWAISYRQNIEKPLDEFLKSQF